MTMDKWKTKERNTTEQSIESIDNEINDHQEVIAHLLRLKNSRLPISRLPLEILSMIFMHCVLAGARDYSYKFCPSSPDSWTKITSVCHRWREAALGTAEMWSHWSTIARQWLEAFAPRSKMAPLYIRLFLSTQHKVDAFVELLKEPETRHRIHEFHVFGHGSSLSPILQCFNQRNDHTTNGTSSQIKSFRICALGRTDAVEIPKPLHGLDYPDLRQLELVGCDFDWESAMFDSSILTHLVVKSYACPHPTMSRLLHILKTQCRLVVLKLQGRAVPIPDETVISCNLPDLTIMKLEGPLISCLQIITNLIYPILTTLSLKLHLHNAFEVTSHLVPCLSNLLAPIFSGSDRNFVIQNLSLDRSKEYIRFRTSRNLDASGSAAGFSLALDMRLNDEAEVVRSTLMAWSFCNLQRLEVIRVGFWMYNWQTVLLGTLMNLKELTVEEDDVAPLVFALEPPNVIESSNAVDPSIHSDAKLVRSRIPLPALTTLRILRADFNEGGADPSLSFGLYACLTKRKNAGLHLETLELQECTNIAADDLEIYDDLVKTVKWDQNVNINDGRYSILWMSGDL